MICKSRDILFMTSRISFTAYDVTDKVSPPQIFDAKYVKIKISIKKRTQNYKFTPLIFVFPKISSLFLSRTMVAP